MSIDEAIKVLEQLSLTLHGKMISKPRPEQVRDAVSLAIQELKKIK